MSQDELKARVTSGGRITVPKELRDRLGLQPGDRIEFTESGDKWRISRRDPGADHGAAGVAE